MKTFRIFLQNGLTAEVVAAKIEKRETADVLALGRSVLCFVSDTGALVAEFREDAVIGVHGELGI